MRLQRRLHLQTTEYSICRRLVLQVVYHGCGGACSLCFIVQRNGLHQVIHGRAGDQGLKGLRAQSQGDKQTEEQETENNAAKRKL